MAGFLLPARRDSTLVGMNISYLRALPIGNAVELLLAVDADCVWLQLLRRLDDDFAGPDDPGATLVYNANRHITPQNDRLPLLDIEDITNGVPLFYQAYGYDGTQWIASRIATITPTQRLVDRSIDPLTLVRDRLKAGIAAEVAAGRLKPAANKIPVWTAPFQGEVKSWPVVTVHLESDRNAERAIGEMIDQDYRLAAPEDWLETEGWLSHVTLTIVGWSQNPDERIALRQALKRIMIGNLPIFASMGLITPDWNQQDSEDFNTFNAPVYQTVGTFTCLAPSMISWTTPDIEQIDVIGKGINE